MTMITWMVGGAAILANVALFAWALWLAPRDARRSCVFAIGLLIGLCGLSASCVIVSPPIGGEPE